jgi:site-specific DNA recombinase
MEKIAAIYCRVSTEDQKREGTSLETQEEACLRLAREKGYKVLEIFRDTYSGLTLDRPSLTALRQKAKDGEVDAVIIYSPDRLSRTGEDILLLAKEFKIEGVKLLFVKEQWDDTHNGKLVAFMLGWASEFEASQIRERTMRGKKHHAEMGDIPSGFGRYPYWGLRYYKKRKRFEHIPDQINIPREILKRCIAGESSSSITVDLQARGIKSATGGRIHRSAVSRVLSHAAVYAGHLTWDGHPIFGKVEPIITEEEANIVTERLKKNKERSYGFGKRKPLTGRVICGLCGRRYNLDANKGCRCNGSDPRNPIKCLSPKVNLGKLTNLIYEAIFTVMMDDEVFIRKTEEVHEQWQRETAEIERKVGDKEAQLAVSEKRRRLLSFQHEMGGVTNEEYVDRLKDIAKERAELTEQIAQLRQFTPAEEPPNSEDVRKALRSVSSAWEKVVCQLAKGVPLLQIALAKDQEKDQQLEQLLDKLNVKAVVYPSDSKERFKLDVLVNIPIQKQKVSDKVIVSPLSLSCARPPPLPPGLA